MPINGKYNVIRHKHDNHRAESLPGITLTWRSVSSVVFQLKLLHRYQLLLVELLLREATGKPNANT